MVVAAELHELSCTGPTKGGCACRKAAPKGNVALLDLNRTAPDWLVAGNASRTGIDMHLSSLETLMVALEQRVLDMEQLERFARILQYGERTALSRLRTRRSQRKGA